MKKLLLALSLSALLLPSIAFAAAYNDVSLTTDAIITVGGLSLNVASTDTVLQSMTVSDNSFTVTLAPGSAFVVTSPDRRTFTVTGQTTSLQQDCTDSYSRLRISSDPSVTFTATVSIDSTTCTNGGGGGGTVSSGGGSSTVTPVATSSATSTTPVATTTVVSTPVITATSPAPVSGLTENQVQSILSLLASFGADQSIINNVNASLHGQRQVSGTTQSASVGTFVRDLKLGMNGDDVKALQVFLNTHGFSITSSGPGSKGSETTWFGALTRKALEKFQAANGISPAVGYFGPKTRAKISSLYGQ